MNLWRSNSSHKQFCCMKGCKWSSRSENLKFFTYRLRNPVMFCVVAMWARQFSVHRTSMGLMHQHTHIVYSDLDESVLFVWYCFVILCILKDWSPFFYIISFIELTKECVTTYAVVCTCNLNHKSASMINTL